MVVTRHIGRLGNSMFQIAAAIGYAKKYGYQWAADTGCGVSDPYSSIHRVFPNLPKENFGGGNRYHEHPNSMCAIHGTHFNDCHFDYHPIPNLGPNVSLTGFFQSYKYFEGQDEEIKRVFALNVDPLRGHTSLHVRRGDYVQHAGSFPPITVDYVQRAIIELENRGVDVYHIHVFSDDIEWCKNNLPHYAQAKIKTSHWYWHTGNEIEDLTVMASCDNHIIANSTFSWWGAYLGHNPNKIIISPSCKRGSWFGMQAGVKKDCVDLLPANWIQIER
jgi:hypothetical protein